MSTAAAYWHTLKYLKPVQFYGRLWIRLPRFRPKRKPAPALRPSTVGWQLPARREPSVVAQRELRFLGRTESLDTVGWDGDGQEKLWRYNQHYFDDLNALNSEERLSWHLDLLQDWVRSNPPVAGTGWEPYPTSLRIVNWVKWAMRGNALGEQLQDSLALQTRWLRARLEIHLLGNHLFANAKALVYAGLFFEGREADDWLHLGLRILRKEVPEQVLDDGGQFERSTMYHALTLEDMLDLCNLLGCSETRLCSEDLALLEHWRGLAGKMLEWLEIMSHPDGEISFFNDCALGIAPSKTELRQYAERLKLTRPGDAFAPNTRWLEASGYARLQRNAAAVFVDMAPVGPDYLPGHAHADTLSFEFSFGSARVIVNSGTSQYGVGSERLRQRGTAAHSTVIVAGQDSSEVWSGFRVARRARVLHALVNDQSTSTTAEACHDGYVRLREGPTHCRRWQLEEASLRVEDELSTGAHAAEARFHLHPRVTVEIEPSGREGRFILPTGTYLRWFAEHGTPRVENSSWHPRFGVNEPSHCLVLSLDGRKSALRIDWINQAS